MVSGTPITLEQFLNDVDTFEAGYHKIYESEIGTEFLIAEAVTTFKQSPWYKLHRLATADGRYGTRYDFSCTGSNNLMIAQHADGKTIIHIEWATPDGATTVIPITPTPCVVDRAVIPIPFLADTIPATLTFDNGKAIIRLATNCTSKGDYWIRTWIPPDALYIETQSSAAHGDKL